MDLYKYRRRLKKDTAMNGIAESTKQIINNIFHESANYQFVFLNGIKFDARVSVEEDETKLEVLFRPNTEVNKGDIVEINANHWLVENVYTNDIYPTAYVLKCNEWLRWKVDNVISVYPCVVKSTSISLEEGKYMIHSENLVEIITPYNEDTKKIKPTQRFILNDKAYEIEGTDILSNVIFGKGYITMKATETLQEVDDNFIDDIADNQGSNWGSW